MITASNVTVQFGEKPLFEDVSVKFGNGHRYGLIGANGSGKTTFMKVLGGELEPTHGNVSVEKHARVGKRERLVLVEQPEGAPFDHGRFEIIVEDC